MEVVPSPGFDEQALSSAELNDFRRLIGEAQAESAAHRILFDRKRV